MSTATNEKEAPTGPAGEQSALQRTLEEIGGVHGLALAARIDGVGEVGVVARVGNLSAQNVPGNTVIQALTTHAGFTFDGGAVFGGDASPNSPHTGRTGGDSDAGS